MDKKAYFLWCLYRMYAGILCVSMSFLVLCASDSSVKPPQAAIEPVILFSQQNDEANKRLSRRGILVTYKDAQATIVLCHGFMCDKFDVGFLRAIFPRGQFNFLAFDFRAHGESTEGQCCTFGRDEAYDVMAAARYVRSQPQLKDKPVFAYGFSMGAVALIEAQAKDKTLFDAMVLDCPFDSTERVLAQSIDRLKISLFGYEFDLPGKSILRRYAFHPYVQAFIKILLKTFVHIDVRNIQTYMCPLKPSESIKKVSVPCLFIHCKNDDKIPTEAIKEVFNGAHGYKSLWLTHGRRHYDSLFYNPERYVERVTKFLNNVKTGKIYTKRRQEKIVEDI